MTAYTMIEIAIVVVNIATLSTITVPVYYRVMQEARMDSAEEEMRQVQTAITQYLATKGALPASLEEVGMADVLDPWGRPYQYLRIATPPGGKGGEGKDSSARTSSSFPSTPTTTSTAWARTARAARH